MPGRSPKFTTAGAVYADDVTLATVNAGAASGTSNAVSAQDWHTLRLNLRGVSFTGGTGPQVTVTVQTSTDGSTNWGAVGGGSAFPATGAGGTARLILTGLDRFLRVSWTSSGTPTNVSFTVDGEAV
jgi:hypothetical protein